MSESHQTKGWQVYFDEHGEPTHVLKIREVPIPQPGPKEIRIKVQARSIHPADLLYIRGQYMIKPKHFPSGAGFEGAGIVDAVGSEVHHLKVGQLINATSSNMIDGGLWAEYAIVTNAVPLPDNLPLGIAAQVTINPLTAYGLLEDGHLKEGEYFLQTAASSSLGKLIIQLAKTQGLKTINVVRRKEHVEELKKLGADEVISTDTEDLAKRVLEITNGKGVRYAIDAVAGEGINEIIKLLDYYGVVNFYGSLSGNANPNVGLLWAKNAKVGAWTLYNWFAVTPLDKVISVQKGIVEAFASGKLHSPFQTFDTQKHLLEAIKEVEKPGRTLKPILI